MKWKDVADRKDTCLSLFYKIVNHEVNVPSDSIIRQVKGGTRESQTHRTFMYILGWTYRQIFFPHTSHPRMDSEQTSKMYINDVCTLACISAPLLCHKSSFKESD